ncbi:MAG: membrane protein insertion efficiency factor YidD [Gemmatimonadota bacterium]
MFRRLALALIRFYQKGISPFTAPSCRFVPTCSSYAHEAIERFGFRRGIWIFLKRFVRCHPFGGKGYDPVPGDPASSKDRAAGDTDSSVHTGLTP